MTDQNALIEAIRAQPEEDTPRLALADWFEENSDAARGEFIRAQCELARLDPLSDRYPELHVRQLDILTERERDWLGEWADHLVNWRFRRGMLEEVTIQPEAYCRGGEGLFRDHPIWRVAFVDDMGESLAPPAVHDVLFRTHSRYLRAIDAAACRPGDQAAAMFGGEIHTNAWLRELVAATHIEGLRELSLFGGTRGGRADIAPDDWRQFCAAGHLRGLTHLDLSNRYDYHGRAGQWEGILRELAGAEFAPGLQSLLCEGCHVGSDALQSLARSRRFQQLRTLTVGGNVTHVSVAAALRELLDEAALPALRSLTIPSGQYLAGVADHPGWSRIDSIGLVGIDDHRDRDSRNHAPAWRAVFRSPHIRPTGFTVGSPGYYDLAATGFWDELTAAAWFGNLKELSISLYDEICTPLFDRPVENFPRLKSLALSPNAELVERLAEWPGLAHLVELGVDHGFGDIQPADPEATVKLFQSQHLTPRLGRLRASGICKSPAAVSALADCAALRGLEHLDFGFNELSEAGAAELAESPHLCHLKSLHTWSEWTESGKPAWLILADPRKFPQLRDVVVGSGTPEEAVDELRRRFGPRLRVFADC